MNLRKAALVSVVFLFGCSSGGTKYDLNAIQGKVTMGMSEFQVTTAIGAPSSIKRDGDVRELKYESQDGKGYLVVVLKSNVVIDTRTGE